MYTQKYFGSKDLQPNFESTKIFIVGEHNLKPNCKKKRKKVGFAFTF